MRYSIPQLDLADFFDPAKKSIFVRALGLAFSTSGYFRLANHGIDFSLIRAYQELSKPLLRAPLERKLALSVPASGGLAGFFRVSKADYYGTVKEDLDMWHVMQEEENFNTRRDFSFRTVWPQKSESFRQLGNALFQEFYRVTETILRASADYLEFPENYLVEKVEGGLTILRVVRYPAADPIEDDIRFDAHKDASLLTILSGGSAAGLELYRETEEAWINVSPNENELVVGVGDLYEAMTEGNFKSALHRVVSKDPLREERFSCPFFITPRAEIPLSILGAKSRGQELVYHFLRKRLGLVIPEYEAKFGSEPSVAVSRRPAQLAADAP